jgi:hypothetical protein
METGAKRRQQTMLSYLDQSNTLLHPLPVPFYKMGISGDNCTFGEFKEGKKLSKFFYFFSYQRSCGFVMHRIVPSIQICIRL